MVQDVNYCWDMYTDGRRIAYTENETPHGEWMSEAEYYGWYLSLDGMNKLQATLSDVKVAREFLVSQNKNQQAMRNKRIYWPDEHVMEPPSWTSHTTTEDCWSGDVWDDGAYHYMDYCDVTECYDDICGTHRVNNLRL